MLWSHTAKEKPQLFRKKLQYCISIAVGTAKIMCFKHQEAVSVVSSRYERLADLRCEYQNQAEAPLLEKTRLPVVTVRKIRKAKPGKDTATPAVIEKLLESALTTGNGRGASPHVEQLLLATESDREARICFIHVILIITPTQELSIVRINILDCHLPVVPTITLFPTRTTHLLVGTSTFLLLGALDNDHLS
ncbi:MAG: hypothetical protein Q9211_001030 [Gyalolechia sp. 1 TL-2023]